MFFVNKNPLTGAPCDRNRPSTVGLGPCPVHHPEAYAAWAAYAVPNQASVTGTHAAPPPTVHAAPSRSWSGPQSTQVAVITCSLPQLIELIADQVAAVMEVRERRAGTPHGHKGRRRRKRDQNGPGAPGK